MLEIIGYLAMALIIALAATLALASTRPDRFQISRTATIAAPPERLFALINDLRQMSTWNPYSLRETTGSPSYSGPSSGPGARSDFAGPKSGTGHIEITAANPPSQVTMRLAMTAPFKANNTVTFTLSSADRATNVTWAMEGRQPLLAKAMTLFIDCDKMVSRDFEEGLRNLKAIAEKA